MNIPFLSIIEPAVPEPGMEMQTGGKAASAGVEFMHLMEAFRSGSIFVENKGRAGSVDFPPYVEDDSGEGFRVTDKPSNKRLGDISSVIGGDAISEDSRPWSNPMAAFAAVNIPENASDTLPAHDDDAPETEGAVLKQTVTAFFENTKPTVSHAPVPDADGKPLSANPSKESASPEGAAVVSKGGQVETGETPRSDEPVPAEAALPGRDKAMNADAGPKVPLKGTGLDGFEPRPQIRDEKSMRADEAFSKAATRSGYPTAAGSESLNAFSSKASFTEDTQTAKDPSRMISGPVTDQEMSVDAEASGMEGSYKEPVTEDYSVSRPSLKTANPDPGVETVLSQSPKHIAFGTDIESFGNYGSGQAAPATNASCDDGGAQEGADTVRAESGEDFRLADNGEPGFPFEFSQGEGGEPHDEPQAERPVGTVAGIAFRDAVDTPSAVEKPMPQVYAADIEKQLEEAVRISVRNGGGEVRMKLNPENLGELTIKLNITKGAVSADIKAESLEVKALLEANSSILKDSLAQQGLTLRECVISVSSKTEAGLPERRDGLFDGRREEAHGSGHGGKNGRKNGYTGGSGQRKAQPAYGGIDLFA